MGPFRRLINLPPYRKWAFQNWDLPISPPRGCWGRAMVLRDWGMKWPKHLSMCVLNHFNCVQLFATLWTVAHQAPLSTGFSRQEYWSGLPCSPPGESSWSRDQRHVSCLLNWQVGSLPLAPPGKPPSLPSLLRRWKLYPFLLNLSGDWDSFDHWNVEEVTSWDLLTPGTEIAWTLPIPSLGDPSWPFQMSRVERGHMEKTQRTRCHMEIEATWSSTQVTAPSNSKYKRNPKRDDRETSQLSPSQPMALWDIIKWLLS